tara:strand:+ start:305 stop:781 length:477 start_codon:yes stop_codon:yes gene_type:complete
MINLILIGFLCWLGVSIVYAYFDFLRRPIGKPLGKEEKRLQFIISLNRFLYHILYALVFPSLLGLIWYGLSLLGGIYTSVCNIFYTSIECIRPNSGLRLISISEGLYFFALSIFFGIQIWLISRGVEKVENLELDAQHKLELSQRRRFLKSLREKNDN